MTTDLRSGFATAGLALGSALLPQAAVVAEFPMDVFDGCVVESLSGSRAAVSGNIGPMEIKGVDGNAWRTDGFTSRVEAQLHDVVDGPAMTATVRFAIDTHAIILQDNDEANRQMVSFASCVNGSQGFEFLLGRTGRFGCRVFVGGEEIRLEGDSMIPLWEWTEMTATVDGRNVRLYLNGREAAAATASAPGVKIDGRLLLGRDPYNNNEWCGARTADFNGAIDFLEIRDDAAAPAPFTPCYADLNIPSSRYDGDRLRARFHGQPGINWTNETHGLFYNQEDGRYHVFFQRTGSAPVMSHAHWGHIVSDDLFSWRDDTPAINPSVAHDLRGCWSGCLFTDEEITGGKPAIMYTGVGYGPGESHAALAFCEDTEHLRKWRKAASPIDTYTNTQRDTYFFRTDPDNAYFVIGDEGFLKQYRYNRATGGWDSHGAFYTFDGVSEGGFTEMPNISRLPDGRWLMTITPWNPAAGVVCLYRIGDINADGKFVNYTEAQKFDLFARDGYGLMSPSIGTSKEGKMIALGIVADKMPTEFNLSHGYAHLYSLPRELGTDAFGLTQKPFPGYEKMRGELSAVMENETVDGCVSLNPVRGRQAEVMGRFVVGDAPFGFNIYKDAQGAGASLRYNPATHELSFDFGRMKRLNNDGAYRAVLPVAPAKGEEMKLHMFVDHSIVDIFVNDRYAASVRIFPTDDEADLIEVFSDGPTMITSLEAYMLGDGDCSAEPIVPEEPEIPESTGRVGFYVGYLSEAELAENPQEYAAFGFFRDSFPGGQIIYCDELSRISTSEFDCVWVNCERDDMQAGWQNMPAELSDGQLIDALSRYVAEGGNLYLSKHAAQLAQAVGVTTCAPTEFGNTSPEAVTTRSPGDEWKVNVAANGSDWSTHAAFYGMRLEEAGYGKLLPLIGGTATHYDRNCMWKLNDFGGHDAFCASQQARVLGTWGHDGGQAWGGIVEFQGKSKGKRAIAADKAERRQGTVIANGLAAYHWAPLNGTVNPYQANIHALTSNILSYLSPAVDNDLETPVVESLAPKVLLKAVPGGISYEAVPAGSWLELYTPDGLRILAADVEGSAVATPSVTGPVIAILRTPDNTYTLKAILR